MTLIGKTKAVLENEKHEQKTELVRNKRNQLIAESDWTQLPDAPDWIDQTAWSAYRKALRGIPEQEGFPTDVIWPEKPQ